MVAPRKLMFFIDFQDMWSKVKVELLIFIISVVYLISFDPLFDLFN